MSERRGKNGALPPITAAPVNHASHWGAFAAWTEGDTLRVVPAPDDPAPSPLLGNVATGLRHKARITYPMVRRGWLERGPGPAERNGDEEFIRLSWPDAIRLAADELRRVYRDHGGTSVYGGSYGWGSAGRFHHAQSQIHRFLNCLGGYVRSVNSYSSGAGHVILPRILGPASEITSNSFRWPDIIERCELLVCFGGMAAKNAMVGGSSRHHVPAQLAALKAAGAQFLLISPIRDDLASTLEADWHAITPGTDAALMLAIAHVLIAEDLFDAAFVARYCVGFEPFRHHVLGKEDGQPRDPAWAAAICGIEASTIIAIARSMARRRTLISVSLSVQRAEHGEQPVWLGVVLAAMLGRIGEKGCGFSYGFGNMADSGADRVAVAVPTLPQFSNPVSAFIPVARISDMLLNPGKRFDYNGRDLVYPDIRLVYWAGGNPFHHHQDLARLERAFARPDTIIVHESAWTATARRADIVLPVTMSLEREDISGAGNDPFLIAMKQLAPPYGEARDDYLIFAALADELGIGAAFTEGRSSHDWLRHLYAATRADAERRGFALPSFDDFWEAGELRLPSEPFDGGLFRQFRDDPDRHPLPTPSGRIEICSAAIAAMGYADCPGRPTYLPSNNTAEQDVTTHDVFYLIANQPATRLHSQLDFGAESAASKIDGREPLRIHPTDAAVLAIEEGDVVRIFNDRGAFLAAATLSTDVMPGVLQIATGAWYDPILQGDGLKLCVHGNPNAVTLDVGTSRLAQGSVGQLCRIRIERFDARPLPAIRIFDPPREAAASVSVGQI